MKLTPRQIEVLIEVMDGPTEGAPRRTSAQNAGRNRVLGNLCGYGQYAMIERRSRQITLYGLLTLKPHYADAARIDKAIAEREQFERERDAAAKAAHAKTAEYQNRYIAARKVKLLTGYRRILSDHGFPQDHMPDDLILSLGDAIAAFEGIT